MSKDRNERLKDMYSEIETLNPEIPADLNKMIRLYSQVLMLIGYIDADASYDAGIAYAERKRLQGDIMKNHNGTGVVKQGESELKAYELRIKEAETKREAKKWTNLFKSTEHLIIALRREERALLAEMKHTTGENHAG